jgi:hypothetical protein
MKELVDSDDFINLDSENNEETLKNTSSPQM